MGTSPEFEYMNLEKMYQLAVQSMAEGDMNEQEKAQHMCIMEMDLFHAALEAEKPEEAEKWVRSVLSRGDQVKAWEKENSDAVFGWWYITAMSMVEEFSALEEK